MANRLQDEDSLYLRQHAENPVDWFPWGEAALALARRENKPLLVSVGYSACHWCHVMAHECFEDEYIAGLMNRHFVCVKVDREERPDVDQVFMEAVQMIQHQGGWPLNVFCLPDGRPFFGGTYFPPEDRGQGLVPWPQVLMRVADFYERSRKELETNADAIQKNILAFNRNQGSDVAARWDEPAMVAAAHGICGNHDDTCGGFGDAPKFPPSMALNLLWALGGSGPVATRAPELGARIDTVLGTTLKAMAHGGLFDQVGGGFARYSVDRHWLIPHFEKMLYDNALLLEAYTRGWVDAKEPLFKAVVEETVGWLDREMRAEFGGFYAALDADSEGGEGRYYVWTPDAVAAVLGEDVARPFCAAYNITESGNFEQGLSNPALVEPTYRTREGFTEARRLLREHRERNRQPPGRDTKVNTSWNAMTLRALADAGFYLNRPDWLRRAQGAADCLLERICSEENGEVRVKAVFYEGSGSRVDGFLPDYALLSDALLVLAGKIDWLEPGISKHYRDRAAALLETALRHFGDGAAPGYFFTADDSESPVARRKEWFDNAVPSGNSAMLQALTGLYGWTGEARYAAVVESMIPVFADYAGKVAAGVAHGLEALTYYARGIPVFKFGQGSDPQTLQSTFSEGHWRRIFLEFSDEAALAGKFQLCHRQTCFEPVASAGQVVRMLHETERSE